MPVKLAKELKTCYPARIKILGKIISEKKIVDLLWPLVYAEIIGRCLVTKCSKGSTPGLPKEPPKISVWQKFRRHFSRGGENAGGGIAM